MTDTSISTKKQETLETIDTAKINEAVDPTKESEISQIRTSENLKISELYPPEKMLPSKSHICHCDAFPPKSKKIKVCPKNVRGETGLFDYFYEIKKWDKTLDPNKAFYNHFALDKGISFEWAAQSWTNRIPGMQELCHKTNTFFALNQSRRFHEDEFDFFPKTFILPNQESEYVEYHKKHSKKIFVSKIDGGGQGVGITQLTKPRDLPSCEDMKFCVVQEYLKDPFLLNNKKHDLRLYMTVIHWHNVTAEGGKKKGNENRLVAFIQEEGQARFCTEDYESPTFKNKNKENKHFTNYSINKHSKEYIHNEECEGVHNGSKKSMSSYWKEVESTNGIKKSEVWDQIKDLCAKILKSFKPWIRYNANIEWGTNRCKAFHILGVDIIFDSKMKPYLLEVNANPSLNVHFDPEDYLKKSNSEKPEVSPIDLYVKSRTLGDIISLLKDYKMKEIVEDMCCYKTYEKIYDESVEGNDLSHVCEMENILEIFCSLIGAKFQPTITSTKFSKIADIFKKLGYNIEKYDADIAFKKVLRFSSHMGYDGFNGAQRLLIEKATNGASKEDDDIISTVINKLHAEVIRCKNNS